MKTKLVVDDYDINLVPTLFYLGLSFQYPEKKRSLIFQIGLSLSSLLLVYFVYISSIYFCYEQIKMNHDNTDHLMNFDTYKSPH